MVCHTCPSGLDAKNLSECSTTVFFKTQREEIYPFVFQTVANTHLIIIIFLTTMAENYEHLSDEQLDQLIAQRREEVRQLDDITCYLPAMWKVLRDLKQEVRFDRIESILRMRPEDRTTSDNEELEECVRLGASYIRKEKRKAKRASKKLRRRARGQYVDTTDSEDELEIAARNTDSESSDDTTDSEQDYLERYQAEQSPAEDPVEPEAELPRDNADQESEPEPDN